MKIEIAITTYNRPSMLNSVLGDIIKKNWPVNITVYNDGSTKEYSIPKQVTEHRFPFNHGKTRYYELVNYLFNQYKEKDFDYFIMIPDDVRLVNDFLERSTAIWDSIQDSTKICLSVGHDHDRHLRPNWTGFVPEVMDRIVKTQWNDLCFISGKEFFNHVPVIEVPDDRWKKDPSLGSGVGQFLSVFFHTHGFSMYHTRDSLVSFDGAIRGEPSMMHR